MALLRLPKLKELGKKRKRGVWVDFTPADVDVDSIRFKDKQREKQRQQNKTIKAAAAKAADEEAVKTNGKAADAAPRTDARGTTAESKKQASKSEEQAGSNVRRSSADDDDDIAREAALMKKLKRGKISKKEFHRLVGESDSGDESDE
eukprot:6173652-Pleurochrysis_carterae.AAC.2